MIIIMNINIMSNAQIFHNVATNIFWREDYGDFITHFVIIIIIIDNHPNIQETRNVRGKLEVYMICTTNPVNYPKITISKKKVWKLCTKYQRQGKLKNKIK